MSQIKCFAPVADTNAKILILGSIPGLASLRAVEYYAHPRNIFWRIIESLINLDAKSSYEQRIQALIVAKIALWDVLQSCSRAGSLDTKIEKSSQIPNNFQFFFEKHPHITHVFFNGAVAEQIYQKLVRPELRISRIAYLRLPSTSPANASITFECKRAAWQAILATGELK